MSDSVNETIDITNDDYMIMISIPRWEYHALEASAKKLGITVPKLLCEIVANWAGHTLSAEDEKEI